MISQEARLVRDGLREGAQEGSHFAGRYRPAGARESAGGCVPLYRGTTPHRTAPPSTITPHLRTVPHLSPKLSRQVLGKSATTDGKVR